MVRPAESTTQSSFTKMRFASHAAGPLPIQVAYPLRLLVADSGQRCATHIPVSAVRDLLLQEPGPTGERLAKIGQIVRHALVALASSAPDAIGPLMNRNHALLRELDVSSLLLDRLVDAAREAGASGAKLSGAGRGGNMIALVNEATEASVSRALSAGRRSARAGDYGSDNGLTHARSCSNGMRPEASQASPSSPSATATIFTCSRSGRIRAWSMIICCARA